MGGNAEEPSTPGTLDILQEGNIKGAGVGHQLVPKDKPAEKTNLAGTQGKKGTFITFGRRGRQLRVIIKIL